MRKTKDAKRKRKLAGIEYRKGNSAEAYKMWAEAAADRKTIQQAKEKKSKSGDQAQASS